MKLSRSDFGPLFTIVVGGAAGAAVTGTVITSVAEGEAILRVDPVVVVTPAVEATTAEPSERPRERARIRSPEGSSGVQFYPHDPTRRGEGPEPLIFVDGVRAAAQVELADLEPGEVERIEVIKGGAAVLIFGPEALGGVIQVSLKPEARAEREREAVERAEAARIRIRGDVSTSEFDKPLVFVDGVLLSDRASFDDLPRDGIEAVEIVTGAEAVRRFGDDATGGVVLVGMKPGFQVRGGR